MTESVDIVHLEVTEIVDIVHLEVTEIVVIVHLEVTEIVDIVHLEVTESVDVVHLEVTESVYIAQAISGYSLLLCLSILSSELPRHSISVYCPVSYLDTLSQYTVQ